MRPAHIVSAVAVIAAASAASAQTDEIQVYDGSIAKPGVINLTLHNNFTPVGLKAPAFPTGLIPDHSFNGVAEWAFGVTRWLEAGLYLPLYSISNSRGATFDGSKIRVLLTEPHTAERRFFFALNLEFSINAAYWEEHRFTSEIRPIVGTRMGSVEVIVNPILDNSYVGWFRGLDFAPVARVAYHVGPAWTVGVEEYADLGQLRGFRPIGQQSHQLWAVFDHTSAWANIEAGVGFGLTDGSDAITVKLMLSRDLYSPSRR